MGQRKHIFVTPPTQELFERHLQERAELRRARKKRKRSALILYIETIQMCVSAGLPLRDIADEIEKSHKVRFHYTTVRNFLRNFPQMLLNSGGTRHG